MKSTSSPRDERIRSGLSPIRRQGVGEGNAGKRDRKGSVKQFALCRCWLTHPKHVAERQSLTQPLQSPCHTDVWADCYRGKAKVVAFGEEYTLVLKVDGSPAD